VDALDFQAVASFWNSKLGRTIRTHRQYVRRELAFTVRIASDELSRLLGSDASPKAVPLDERVIIQGVADLALLAPDGLTLVDFKTDQVNLSDLPVLTAHYAAQVRLYAAALSRIYGIPVASCWLFYLRLAHAVQVPVELDTRSKILKPTEGVSQPGLGK
jgi:ATP-dependent helicase/nuclease subunit A